METGPTLSEELSSTSQAPQPLQYKPPPQRPSPQQPPPQLTTTTVQSTTMAQPGMAVYPVNSCRSCARCVAYFDIVIAVFAILFMLYIMIALLVLSSQQSSGDLNSPDEDPTLLTVLAFIAGITVVGNIIDICISCSLLTATEEDTLPSVAISKAKCWLWCNIILAIFSFFGSTTSAGAREFVGTGGFVFVFLRIIFIIIVWKFIKELEISAQSAYLGYAGAQPMTTTAMSYQQQYQQKPYQQQNQQQPYQQQPNQQQPNQQQPNQQQPNQQQPNQQQPNQQQPNQQQHQQQPYQQQPNQQQPNQQPYQQ